MKSVPRSLITHDIEQRFWENVSPGPADACWEWQGKRTPERKNLIAGYSCGYGYLVVHPRTGLAKMQYAHRLAYALLVGDVPAGKIVMHECDNPRCCNPHHLRLGTKADNARDRERRQRRPNTIQRDPAHEDRIIRDYLDGYKWDEIARRNKCSPGTIMAVLHARDVPRNRKRGRAPVSLMGSLFPEMG